MATAELTYAFGEWVGDLKDLRFGFDDTVLPIGALVGVYIAACPTERTTYALTQAVMEDAQVLAAARVILGSRHRDEIEAFDEYEFEIPSIEGPSGVYHHIRKALWDGRPDDATRICEADFRIAQAVGSASYDFMVGFEPLRLLDTGRPHLAQLPRSFAIIEAANL